MTADILSNLKPAPGATKKRKRIGRGQGSGHGKTSTRGHKGQGARAGASYRPWFEGGQMPLVRRLPKRGFHSPFKTEYQIVNVDVLEKLAADGRMQSGIVTPEILSRIGVVKKASALVKILGSGELKAKLEVVAHAFSKSAVQKIEAAGGKTRVLTSTTNK